MKIIVKQDSWWGTKQGGINKEEKTFEYLDDTLFNGAKILVDYTQREKIVEKKNIFGKVKSSEKVYYEDIKFGFIVVEKNKDEIDLEILGGPFYIEDDKTKNQNLITLKLNESKSFRIQMMDAGDTYTITLLDD